MNKVSIKPCTVCESSHAAYLFDKAGDGRGAGPISLYRCRQCTTVYLGGYNDDYDDGLYEYYRYYQGKPKEVLYSPLTVKSYLNVLDLFEKHTAGKSILDVGCGKGDFVDAAMQAGWDIQGIELAQPAVDIAQGYGLPVQRLDFFSDFIKPASRDIVTLFEVLEHLPFPGKFLSRAEEVVKPGGLIYLTTPNWGSLDRRILGADWPVIHREHLTYFTQDSLLSSIRQNTGFHVLHSETRNISAQTFQNIKRRFIVHRQSISPSSLASSGDHHNAIDIRALIEGSRYLQVIKRVINLGLNLTSTGNTIVLLLQKPFK